MPNRMTMNVIHKPNGGYIMNEDKQYDYDSLTKEEFEEMINDSLNKDELILQLQVQLKNRSSADGRKSQVMKILVDHGPITIMNIANKLGISTKNVSSQLSYLRTDGYQIFTDNNGKKFIYEA